MRTRLRRTPKNPCGSAIMLFGLMLPVLVGFVALSVDIGVLAVARAQLSTAADAAALAGARKLAVAQLATDPNAIPEANTQAATIGQANLVLGQAPVITQNPSNAIGVGDIMVGYIDPNNLDPTYLKSPLDSSGSASSFNSVQVTVRRSADHVGLVPSFFGQLMGFNGTPVSVQSTATADKTVVPIKVYISR
jgi:Flp pilus assembly protein TadG